MDSKRIINAFGIKQRLDLIPTEAGGDFLLYKEKISCFKVAFLILSSWGKTPIPGECGTSIVPWGVISMGGSIRSCL
jgi:hypothetical protein